jgi:hypothetical protein
MDVVELFVFGLGGGELLLELLMDRFEARDKVFRSWVLRGVCGA